ncbi:MAG: MBL fold metallo-hydrolase [Lachnospiraceae bacterium]|nr:MBL fold metallo-hydrolase [Lachnospiraceae bacterium]
MVDIKHIVLGPVATNVYIVSNPETGEAVLIDPAERGRLIFDTFNELGLKCAAVFLTHGHFDHITGLKSFNENAHAPVYACEAEREVLADSRLNRSVDGLGLGGSDIQADVDHFLKDKEEFDVAGLHWKMLWTPGHTAGSCCFYLEEEKALFSGDTLFAGSIGRTDLPTGSMSELLRSLKEKLMGLPDDTGVFPGHGEFTDLGTEKKYNPFFSV